MKKNILFTVAILFFITEVFCQSKSFISFKETDHDFGAIKEEGGAVLFDFVFTNTGKSPLIIENVKASCGCTTPGWSTDSIMPNKTGFIKVEFDPNNRPGPFNKTLTVTSNAEPNISVLSIRGTVTPRPRNPKDDYPVALGNIRAKSSYLKFGNMTTEKPIIKEFYIFNNSEDTIRFADTVSAPNFIRAAVIPKRLQPHERGILSVIYNPRVKKVLGYTQDQIIVYSNDKNEPEKKFMVEATVEEFFPAMTEKELSTSPHITFDRIAHDFGSLRDNQSVTTSFYFSNSGQKDLNIRQIQTNCGCINSEIEKDILKPGESGTLKVTFDPSGRKGRQIKTIALFTNDPSGPTKVLTVKADVKD